MAIAHYWEMIAHCPGIRVKWDRAEKQSNCEDSCSKQQSKVCLGNLLPENRPGSHSSLGKSSWQYFIIIVLSATDRYFQEGAITGENYPFSSEAAFPSSSGSKYRLISGGDRF